MILDYFDNICYNIFYNQESKKVIYSTRNDKERDFIHKICNEENLEYFCENDNNTNYSRGLEFFKINMIILDVPKLH